MWWLEISMKVTGEFWFGNIFLGKQSGNGHVRHCFGSGRSRCDGRVHWRNSLQGIWNNPPITGTERRVHMNLIYWKSVEELSAVVNHRHRLACLHEIDALRQGQFRSRELWKILKKLRHAVSLNIMQLWIGMQGRPSPLHGGADFPDLHPSLCSSFYLHIPCLFYPSSISSPHPSDVPCFHFQGSGGIPTPTNSFRNWERT